MIIDMHTHIGNMLGFTMPGQQLLDSMDKYDIGFSLTSSTLGAECDHQQNDIPKQEQYSQFDANMLAVDFARQNKEKIGVLLWCKVKNETPDEHFRELFLKNRDVIFGLKFHPFHSNTPFDGEKTERFLAFAKEFGLPVLVHTATDDSSQPDRVYRAAKRHPEINFILGHMGLGDNSRAQSLVKELPNLYGDTCWVEPSCTLALIESGYEDKLMFGTDNTIDGLDTLLNPYYQEYIHGFKSKITSLQYDKLMYLNAQKVFRLKR